MFVYEIHLQNTDGFNWFQLLKQFLLFFGFPQLELLGQSVYDFVHPCDQEELRDLLAPRPG